MALKQLDAYSYNNSAFTDLYKLQGEDQTLEAYCRQLERSNTNKTVGIILCFVLLIVSLVGYYFLYMRKRLQNRLNLEQVLEINQRYLRHLWSDRRNKKMLRHSNGRKVRLKKSRNVLWMKHSLR